MTQLEKYFEFLHNNPPSPFNPSYDPNASERLHKICSEMEAEGFYKTHTREECRIEIARREREAAQ